MTTPSLSREEILGQLDRVLSSAVFEGAGRASALLRFLVVQAVAQPTDQLKEYTIGTEALGRDDSFDPRTDPIVRAEASRLRTRLDRYYATDGSADPIVITLPKGRYIPTFRARAVADGSAGEIARPFASRTLWFAAACVAMALVASFLFVALRRGAPAVAPAPMHFEVELLSSGASLGAELGTDVILSPDGSRLVFVSRAADGLTRLNQRRLDRPAATLLRGTEGAHFPFFSPDGQWIGFWADGKLKKVPIEGGSPLDLSDAPDFRGGSWSADGTIIVASGPGELWRLPSSPTDGAVIGKYRWDSVTAAWPEVLPGGRAVLFTALGPLGADRANIEVLSLSSGERKTVIKGGTFGRYLPQGYLTYVNQGTLFAVAFDVETMAVRGVPVPILEDVSYSSTFGFAQIDFSRNGTLVYRRSAGGGMLALSWLSPSGETQPVIAKGGHYRFPRLSPDGARVAVALSESGTNYVSVFDITGRQLARWTAGAGAYGLVWTTDGRNVISGGTGGMSWVHVRDAPAPEPLMRTNTIQIPWSLTGDGKRLAYHELNPSTHFDIWTIPIESVNGRLIAGRPEPFLNTPAIETYPSFSPDGRWIAYTSSHGGTWDVYVRRFPHDGSPPVQVSRGGGRIARWLPDSEEILFRKDDRRLMTASYKVNGSSFEVGPSREWSAAQLGDTGVLANFDVDPTGKVLALMATAPPEERQSANHVTVRLNFASELQQRLARSSQ
jgi:eukaryotic-like serine/threonine-protein kinase